MNGVYLLQRRGNAHRTNVDGDKMTMEKKSTYGLRRDQMADLFALGAQDPDPVTEKHHDETLRALLHEQLTCVTPRGSLLRETLNMLIDPAGTQATGLDNKSLGEILVSPPSDLELLRALKDASKMLSCTLDSQSDTALARTIYFATVAAALVHHDAKITQMTNETLAESLGLLLEKPWMTSELIELFSQARRVCQARSGER